MRRALSFLVFASLILILIIAGLKFLFRTTPEYPIQKLEKGWTVIYRNEEFINTNLEQMSKQVGTTFSRGDTITLNYEKPLDYPKVPFPYLLFKTQYCGYRIYIDGEVIAEKNADNLAQSEFVGIAYNSIPLPRDLAGKKLSIKLFVCEANTRADMVSPLIGNYDDLNRQHMLSAIYPAVTSIFLIVYGLVFLVISLSFYVKSSGVAPQVITSFLCVSLGIWMNTALDYCDFVVNSNYATAAEFGTLYTLIPLVYMLIASLHKRINNIVVHFLAIASSAFYMLFISLHAFNYVHLNQFQQAYYFMSAISFAMLLLYDYIDITSKVKRSTTYILMFGLTVLSITLGIYGVFGLLKSYIDYRQNRLLILILPSGCLFFVMIQLLNHLIFMTRSYAQRNEYLSLTQIAYVDNLTGIPNRASCDESLAKLEETNIDFCILSLDLNGLKEVNDNSGHPAGDRLLKSFAGAMTSVFGEVGECFRVGGDEFTVLFKKIEKDTLDRMLKDLDARLKKLDEIDTEANHSVSYGYAYRSETKERDTHTVYMLADSRMYEYKRKYYNDLMTR